MGQERYQGFLSIRIQIDEFDHNVQLFNQPSFTFISSLNMPTFPWAVAYSGQVAMIYWIHQ
jgi:hypothetical protein